MANIFPRGSNILPIKIVVCALVLVNAVSMGMWYYFTPKYTRVGYQPAQPVPFPHDVHVGQLGMDCRYCHSFVEVAAHSNIPTTQVCMNCHSQVQRDNPKLAPIRDSWASGKPVEWVQIHKTSDFVYFNHSAHVNRGVSCVSCHGKVNEMPVVYHAKPHSMAWCLDCHRDPKSALRPLNQITNLNWEPKDEDVQKFVSTFGRPEGWEGKDITKSTDKLTQEDIGSVLLNKWHINPPDKNCAGCHR
ncbi:MAG: cytochrome c3 family protein [Chthoniobacter sp.]